MLQIEPQLSSSAIEITFSPSGCCGAESSSTTGPKITAPQQRSPPTPRRVVRPLIPPIHGLHMLHKEQNAGPSSSSVEELPADLLLAPPIDPSTSSCLSPRREVGPPVLRRRRSLLALYSSTTPPGEEGDKTTTAPTQHTADNVATTESSAPQPTQHTPPQVSQTFISSDPTNGNQTDPSTRSPAIGAASPPATSSWADIVASTPCPQPKRKPYMRSIHWNPSMRPDWFLYPTVNNVYAVLDYVLIAPLTLVTPLNLFYQMYLFEIFHTNYISRGIHFLMMPFVTWTYLLFAAYFELPFFESNPTTICPSTADCRSVDIFAIRGNALLAGFFLIWWVIWGFRAKAYAMGFFMIPHLFLMWVTSNVFHSLTKYADGATWYSPAPMLANPLFLAPLFAFIQALSHLAEDLPPRMNGTDHWMNFTQFFSRYWNQKWYMVVLLAIPTFFSPMNEFLAGPRLLPLVMLRQMYALGYNEEQWQEIQAVIKTVRASGDPSVDVVGEGGTLPPTKEGPPKDREEAKEELRVLHVRRARNEDIHLDEDEEMRIAYLTLLLKKEAVMKQPTESSSSVVNSDVVISTGIKEEKEQQPQQHFPVTITLSREQESDRGVVHGCVGGAEGTVVSTHSHKLRDSTEGVAGVDGCSVRLAFDRTLRHRARTASIS